MRKRKRVFAFYRYTECDCMAAYLEGMARKGWHFSGWRLGMIFEKGEPENTEYAVEVFQKGSEEDRRPEADAEEYGEYCEAAGWKLVDSRKKFCVFRKIREDAVPIVTEEERFENIRKAEFVYRLQRLLPFGLMAGMDWWGFFTVSAENWLFSNLMLTELLLITLLILLEVVKMAGLAVWSVQKKREWRAGSVPFYGSRNGIVCRWQRVRAAVYGAPFAILTVIVGMQGEFAVMVTFLAVLILVLALEAGIEFLRPERGTRWLLFLWGIIVVFIGFMIAVLIMLCISVEIEEQQNRTISVDTGQSEEADLAVESFEEQESIFGTRQRSFMKVRIPGFCSFCGERRPTGLPVRRSRRKSWKRSGYRQSRETDGAGTLFCIRNSCWSLRILTAWRNRTGFRSSKTIWITDCWKFRNRSAV